MNRETLTNIFSSLPSDKSAESERKKKARKLVKDTIEAYCNKEKLEAEAAINAKK